MLLCANGDGPAIQLARREFGACLLDSEYISSWVLLEPP